MPLGTTLMNKPTIRFSEDHAALDAALGYGLLRLTLGVDFLFHAYQRWFDPAGFIDGIVRDFARTPLPVWSVRLFAASTLGWEPFVGLLLVLGLWTRLALVAGGLLIVALVFGTALRAQYTVLSEQLIYALLFFVLLLFRSGHDRFGLDGLLFSTPKKGAPCGSSGSC